MTMCIIALKVKPGFYPYSSRMNWRDLVTGHCFLYHRQEAPKRIKKVLRIARQTKSRIVSIKSVYNKDGEWVKVFNIQGGNHAD